MDRIRNEKTVKVLLVGFLIVLMIGVLLIFGYSQFKDYGGPINNSNCDIKLVKDIVRGTSMEPIIKNGQEIAVAEGYYNCNSVKRGDVVIYSYSTNREPLIKRVAGIEGDRISLQNKNGEFLILINGAVATNMVGKTYELPPNKTKMLQLYIKDYKGIIPKNSILLMGNEIDGSFDSTSIGLVDVSGLVGKVVEY